MVLVSARFLYVQAPLTNFQKAVCIATSFKEANLINASFSGSNVKRGSFEGASVKGTDFSHANLYGAIFTNTSIIGEQLESALAIQDAVLPDGTQVLDKNLIDHGDNNCNISHANGWILRNGSLTAIVSNNSNGYCNFTLQTNSTEAIICKRVDLSKKWDSTAWSYSQAILRANMSKGVSMELKGINSNGHILARQTLGNFDSANYDKHISSICRFY